ncbi:hypothetical protein AURDEDRAFT_163418 [Auricularia subglabra TFB-10046 SS5]|nr:hypothetical protein AURDEDRAFT_163418 [Auricularia subglabra TFB-10046 SS5]
MLPGSVFATLPDELCLKIWHHLARRDILLVTHVCSLWRAVALACPALWRDISFIWARNSDICLCSLCVPYPPLSTSFDYLSALVARSQEMAVRLDIEIISAQSIDIPDRLIDTFAQLAPRLEHFSLRGTAPMLAVFLARTPCLPVLRTLTSVPHVDRFDDTAAVDLLQSIECPKLEALDLLGPLVWPPSREAVRLAIPNVRSLSLYPLRWGAVLSLLDECPYVCTLKIAIWPIIYHGRGLVRIPSERRQRMPALRLTQPVRLSVECIRQFQDERFPDIMLDTEAVKMRDWWAVELFRPVRDADLAVTHCEQGRQLLHGRCVVSARTADGRRRAIDVPYRDMRTMPSLGAYLSLASVRTAEIHLSLWTYCLRDGPAFPALADLTLVVFASSDVMRAVESEATAGHHRATPFPALRALRIEHCFPRPKVPSHSISALVSALSLPAAVDRFVWMSWTDSPAQIMEA